MTVAGGSWGEPSMCGEGFVEGHLSSGRSLSGDDSTSPSFPLPMFLFIFVTEGG